MSPMPTLITTATSTFCDARRWEKPARLSLLRNEVRGVFEDVTAAAGLAKPISTEPAGWGDYDNDGKVDLFVCGEYTGKTPDPRCRSRLYHNQGNGTFVNALPPLKWCSFWANPSIDEFIAQGPVPTLWTQVDPVCFLSSPKSRTGWPPTTLWVRLEQFRPHGSQRLTT